MLLSNIYAAALITGPDEPILNSRMDSQVVNHNAHQKGKIAKIHLFLAQKSRKTIKPACVSNVFGAISVMGRLSPTDVTFPILLR